MKKALALLIALAAPGHVSAEESWTGYQLGLQVGNQHIKAKGTGESNPTLGVHAGYLHDFGDYVFGGEFSYDAAAKYTVGGVSKSVKTTRLKIKGGHSFGDTLLYGVFGYAGLDTGGTKEDGYTAGIGVSYRLTPRVILGLEYLHDTYSSGGADTEADSVFLKASYKF
ncbi:outer membrane protein [Phaeobacter gallaeciensis]|nr:outer membrane beta-barrel protein [Phaeobacter gallaeciensis]